MNALPSLLLVDDDDTLRQVLANALVKRGYAVIAAASAEQGIALAETDPPQYAIVDLKMPGASGLTLVRRLA